MAGELERISRELEDLTAAARQAHDAIADSKAGTDLVAVDPAAKKKELQARRSQLVAVTTALEAKTDELRRAAQEQVNATRNAMAPLLDQIDQLKDGLEAIELYLGVDERIVCVRSGTPAPPDTPIAVRQLVLYADEEAAIGTAAALDTTISGGIGAVTMEVFDDWLLADPAHLDRILPEQRCVVAVRPRRNRHHDFRRADPDDLVTHFLIRNGEEIHRTYTDDFNVGQFLVPRRSEMERLFTTVVDGQRVPLRPGSLEWDRAEEQAERTQKRLFKVVLVLEGLLTRTAVFHPLPPGVTFIGEASYEAGHINVVADGDPQLVIGDGREPFADYQRRLNNQLEPGMRIVGGFDTDLFPSEDYARSSRLSPSTADRPAARQLHTLLAHRGGLRILYPTRNWAGETQRRRASCVVEAADRWILPFDLIDLEDLRYYLDSRIDRANYLTLVPVLTAAIELKVAEQAEEAPFRDLLARSCGDGDNPASAATIDDLVKWWKTKRRQHRPLVGDEEAAAFRDIVAEHRRRTKRTRRPDLTSTLLDGHPEAVAIGTKPDGTWLVIEAENDANIFCAVHPFSITGKARPTKRWRTFDYRWHNLHLTYQTDRWAQWDTNATASQHLTDPEVEDLTQAVLAQFSSQETMPYERIWNPETRRHEQVQMEWAPVAYIAASHRHADTRRMIYEIVCAGHDADFDPDRPLTVAASAGDIRVWRISWSRNRDRSVRFDLDLDRTIRRNLDDRWEPRSGTVVYRDEEAIAALIAERDRYRRHNAHRGELATQSHDLTQQIAEQYQAERLAEQKETFIAKYGDATLWEDHSKSISVEYLPRTQRSIVKAIADTAIEDGLDISGLTVAETIAANPNSEQWASELDAEVGHLVFGPPQRP